VRERRLGAGSGRLAAADWGNEIFLEAGIGRSSPRVADKQQPLVLLLLAVAFPFVNLLLFMSAAVVEVNSRWLRIVEYLRILMCVHVSSTLALASNRDD